jgi:hypothetical protein
MSTADGGGAALDPTVDAQSELGAIRARADADMATRILEHAVEAVAAADAKFKQAEADVQAAKQAQKEAAVAFKAAQKQADELGGES